MSRVHLIVMLLAVSASAGCLPDLGGWRVVDPNSDGGRPVSDAFIGPVDDCSAPIPIGDGYRDGFEEGPGGWAIVAEGSGEPTWHWGRPSQEFIGRAASGENVWMTRLDGNYNDNEDSFLVSPCFDASAVGGDLLLELWRTVHTERGNDRATVEYSVDGGVTWLGTHENRRFNWYDNNNGWTYREEWEQAATLLVGTAGQARVQVRVRFRSDYSADDEGFAFDDFTLREATTDLAIEVVEGERCGYAEATVTNVGGLPVAGFEVMTTLDGVSGIETYDGTLDYLRTQTYELGGELARDAGFSVFTVGDTDGSNDSASIQHRSTPLGGGYFSDFELDSGGLVVGGSNPSWAWGEPGGELISSAASGTRGWFTNLVGDYNGSERSFIQTACFDMSSATRDPQISLMRVFRTEECCDGVQVEVSVDGGSYRTIGSTSSGGTNWYNSSRWGWTGASGGGTWGLAQHALDRTMGHAAVRVRFRFVSDGNTHFEGFGIDDVQIIP